MKTELLKGEERIDSEMTRNVLRVSKRIYSINVSIIVDFIVAHSLR